MVLVKAKCSPCSRCKVFVRNEVSTDDVESGGSIGAMRRRERLSCDTTNARSAARSAVSPHCLTPLVMPHLLAAAGGSGWTTMQRCSMNPVRGSTSLRFQFWKAAAGSDQETCFSKSSANS